MQTMKFVTTVAMCALSCGAFADWRLTMSPASLQVDFGAPGILEIRIRNTGDSTSPAQSVTSQGGRFGSVALDYEVTPLSGGCGNWITISSGFTAQFASQFSIPEIAPQSELKCLFSFTARRMGVASFDEQFKYYTGTLPSLELGTIKIGGLTDLGATANLISTSQVKGQIVSRYRLNVRNYGQFPVQAYSYSSCDEPPNFTVDTNFPGGCLTTYQMSFCNVGLSAGPIQPGEGAKCEFETTGNNGADLAAIRLFPRITRPAPDYRLLLDINPENDVLRLVPADPVQVPTLSWLGLMALIFGVVLVKRHAQ